jgi:hypothetical protein
VLRNGYQHYGDECFCLLGYGRVYTDMGTCRLAWRRVDWYVVAVDFRHFVPSHSELSSKALWRTLKLEAAKSA